MPMKIKKMKGRIFLFSVLAIAMTLVSAGAIEPQPLVNFQVSPGDVTASLVQGPDGNFYGTTAQGGPLGQGTLFQVTPSGVFTVLRSDQANPAAGLVVGSDGLLYGMSSAGGGGAGFGSVFKMTTNGDLATIAILDGVNAGNPLSGLILAGDGNFYGASQEGGIEGIGAAFRVTPAGVVTTLFSFLGDTNGGAPTVGLTLGPDGNLYGMTSFGGTFGEGTIFKLTTVGALTTIYSFQSGDGSGRQSQLTLGKDGNLYGVSSDGGSADLGTVFRVTTSGAFTNLVSFNSTNGSSPQGVLAVGPGGQLYGTTLQGGSGNFGTIFKMTTSGTLTTLVNFTSAATGEPQAGLLLASDGNFYGCSSGTVFKMTPTSVVSTLAFLIPVAGQAPEAGLTLGPDGNFYGTTRNGGTNSLGTIFRMSLDGTFTSLFSFSNTNGAAPQGALTVGPDGNFYGTTTLGGTSGSGTIFRCSTNGAATLLASFNGTNGANPQCQLVMDANGNFYGTAPEGGPNSLGALFRVNANGSLTTLVLFNGTNGANPTDGLTVGPDGIFYGTASEKGGGQLAGTVFKVTANGTLTTIASFNSTNGAIPLGGVVQGNGGIFYGTTAFGGTNQFGPGNIFKVTTNGVLTPLHFLAFAEGSEPSTKMIFGPDGNLYGTALFGGSTTNDPTDNGSGTVFRITTNGVFTPLLVFQHTNGANPQAPLILGPDGNLYGTTANGGSGGGGTIFRIVLTPKINSVIKAADASITLSGIGPSATAYRLWAATDLSIPFASWTLLTNGVFASDGTFSFNDTGAAAVPTRFYRISVP